MDPLTEVVVGELVKNIISILQQNNIRLIKGVKKDADKLSSTLSAVQAVLEDAEATQFTNKSITDWLRKLKHATYDAEDILEDLSLEAQIRDQEEEVATHPRGCTSQVSHSVSTTCFDFNHIIFRHKIAKKLKSILGRFEDIAKEKSQSQFQPSDHAPSQTESELAKMRETSSRLSEPKIYGRDEDIKEVIDMLVDKDHSRTENVFILPIIGIGGLGKTTLAQLVYNNERIVSSFQKRIWVCVSEPFYVKRVLKQILESFGGCNFESLNSIESEVVKSLQDKKYLLVLDDVWNNDKDKWNELRSSLTSGASGSSIMVTTRSTRVASITSSSPPYNLEGLSNEQCWSLLKYRALGEEGEEELPELVPIGMEIAKKCKGVPLAAKSLGSLLESKTNKNHWEHVRDSPLWDLEETEENKILPALRLSYNHLPSRLKQCFSYCSIYPKDSQLNRIKLVYLWMANGFIQSQGRLELEDVGEDIFHELLRLSFFQDTEEDDYGNVITCKMHDLMHDLACSVMVEECLIAEVGEVKGVVKTIRHLTVVPDSEESSTAPDCVMTSELSLRTLFFFEPINFHSFKFSTTLRVLNLMHVDLTTLPKSICQLQHLRYLDLASNSLNSLPEFICRLRNLQMLDLSENDELTTLPLSIGTLQHLRYLNLSGTRIEFSVIDRLINLENLRYLDLSAGRLSTSLPESTGRFKKLQRLKLSCNGITSLPVSIGNMESLRYLDLSGCRDITSLPESVGGLRNLESLILSGCYSLEVLVKSMRNMSSLRHLDLQGTHLLKEMPVGLGESTCLRRLEYFVVGTDSECGGINELHGLNQLRGELEIKWLENVRNAQDGKEAKLSSKRFLKELTLSWEKKVTKISESEKVLEGLLLQPPPNLQTLNIYRYPGVCFHQGIQHLTSLHKLNILGCSELELETEDFQHLTSLRELKLWDLPKLELEKENFQHLISLCELYLRRLPKLRALSLPQHLTMLQTLHIEDCKNLTSLSKGLQYLTSLHRLEIGYCLELELETEDFQHLISLRKLELRVLPKLRALPLPQHLTVLQTLDISSCKNLTSLSKGLQYLTSLESLHIYCCSELELETEDLQHLISLRELLLSELPKLRALPLPQHLTMLQTLEISSCENLRRLPDGIQHLTTLQSLKFTNCHEDLHKRCEKEKGDDWHLISHIPNINIR